MWLLFVFTVDGKRGQRKSQEASSVSWRRGGISRKSLSRKILPGSVSGREEGGCSVVAAGDNGLGTLTHSSRAQTPGQELQKLKTLDVGKLT